MKRAAKKATPLLVGILGLPAAAMAQGLPPPPGGVTLPYNPQFSSPTFIGSLAKTIADWMFWGLVVFSIIMALVAGYRYLTSAGDPDKVSKANNTLLYAAVAIIVALIAQAIPFIIANILGSPISGSFLL